MNVFIHQGSEWYGSDVVFWGTAVSLVNKNDKIILPTAGLLEKKISEAGFKVEIKKFSKIYKRTNILYYFLDLVLLIRDLVRFYSTIKKAQKVYISTVKMPQFIFLGLLLNKIVVLHVHELPPKILRLTYRLIAKTFGKKFQIIAVSTWLNDAMRLPNSIMIPNFVHPDKTIEGLDRSKRKKSAPFIFAYVGRFNSWKGQEIIPNAANLVCSSSNKPFEVHFFGDAYVGKEYFYTELASLVNRLDLKSVTQFRGFSLNMAKNYSDIDCLIVPSKEKEPFGLVVIEALANGIPVIASNQPTFIEILNYKDLEMGLFESENRMDLKNKMIEFLDMEEVQIKKIEVAGVERAKDFSFETFQVNMVENWKKTG